MPDIRSGNYLPNVVWPGSKGKRTGPWRPRTSCSSLGAFAVCPQVHGFGYEMGIGPSEVREATTIGSLIHVGLAYRYGLMLKERPEWLVYPDARTALWTCGQNVPDLATEALRIFDAYQAHYAVNIWTPILVEHQMQAEMPIPGGEPELYTLRIDLLAYDEWGQLCLVDHKSAYKLSKWTGVDYRADREMLTGLALCRAAGYDVKRVVINAMTKERPAPNFGRFDVPISETAYARLGAETVHWIQRMRAVKAEYPDPANRPRTYESCVRKFGRCDFYSICADGPHRIAEFVHKWQKKPEAAK